ncbi:3-isopropylmalate dehydratase small subunit [Phenylobacterium sp.]|jgi:3-isopropylmalate dehydratase/3-isopropylmalate/(R)-2-methylmalate dehydratase small subunit|uniref:3-isopropylmalate dehydratase small subunit n=1 Tax=Phenylobacterium sp. TaxID=1871053 RepID=UPI002F4231C6
MTPFTRIDARAVPLPQANIDTDQIIPKQFLKTVERAGLAKGLFYDLRFDGEGRPRPDFVLNRPEYQGAGLLVCGDNFGCGSSREHAPWALMDFGVTCVISTSFADIFYSNCFQNGLLPVVLEAQEVQALMAEAKGGNHLVTVDLEAQTVVSPSGRTFAFQIDPTRKHKMLNGLDAVAETLQAAKAIDVYEMRQALAQPWLEGV